MNPAKFAHVKSADGQAFIDWLISPEGQKAPMFNDLYVDTDGLIYVTNRIKGGLYILEYTGPKIQ